MNKNIKIVFVIILSIIVISLIFLLLYANFGINSQTQNANNDNSSLQIIDNGNSIDVKINKEFSYENILLKDFNYTAYKDKNITMLNFKITNNTSEKLYSFYIMLYLKNDKDEVIYEKLLKVDSIDIGMTRYVSFEVDKKISDIYDFEFKKAIVDGVG